MEGWGVVGPPGRPSSNITPRTAIDVTTTLERSTRRRRRKTPMRRRHRRNLHSNSLVRSPSAPMPIMTRCCDMMGPSTIVFLLVLLLHTSPPAYALTMPNVFSSNMVLQRSPQAAHLWGVAASNSIVSITLDQTRYRVSARPHRRLLLPPPSRGGLHRPHAVHQRGQLHADVHQRGVRRRVPVLGAVQHGDQRGLHLRRRRGHR